MEDRRSLSLCCVRLLHAERMLIPQNRCERKCNNLYKHWRIIESNTWANVWRTFPGYDVNIKVFIRRGRSYRNLLAEGNQYRLWYHPVWIQLSQQLDEKGCLADLSSMTSPSMRTWHHDDFLPEERGSGAVILEHAALKLDLRRAGNPRRSAKNPSIGGCSMPQSKYTSARVYFYKSLSTHGVEKALNYLWQTDGQYSSITQSPVPGRWMPW